MIKHFPLIALLIFSATIEVQAADSMTVLKSSGKFIVLINEIGQEKLSKIFNGFVSDPNQTQLDWSTNGDSTSDVDVKCTRGLNIDPSTAPYSCTFTFAPSANVRISGNSLAANMAT